jgi:hypothetical protein
MMLLKISTVHDEGSDCSECGCSYGEPSLKHEEVSLADLIKGLKDYELQQYGLVRITPDSKGEFDHYTLKAMKSHGWVHAGEYLEYSINVTSTNTYSFVAYVGSPTSGGTFHLRVDGVDVPGSVTVPATGSWSTFVATTPLPVTLTAGDHTLRVVFDTDGSTSFVGNLDYMTF